MRCSHVTVASPLHDPQALEPLLAPYGRVLGELGSMPATPRDVPGTELLAVLVATGGTEQQILDLTAQRPGRPVLLVSHPGHNSLPAALEALARVQQSGGRGRIVYLSGPADMVGRAQLQQAVEDFAVEARLRAIRIGLIGPPSDWLVASSPDPDLVRRVWGPVVEPVTLTELYACTPEDDDQRGVEAAGATAVAVETDALARAAALHTGLERLVAERRLDALALRCFDVITDLGTTGCVALSRLNDAGIVAGCEGDVPATLGILWARELLGVSGWMANPARLDVRAGTMTLAHCTVPLGLTVEHRLDTHFESGIGVGIAGRIPRGPVTLVRIGGRDLRGVWLVDAEVVGSGDDPALCRTQLDVRVPGEALDELLARPLGNHVVVVPGHDSERLRRWWSQFVEPAASAPLHLAAAEQRQ